MARRKTIRRKRPVRRRRTLGATRVRRVKRPSRGVVIVNGSTPRRRRSYAKRRKAVKRRSPRRVNGSIMGKAFNIKNFIKSVGIGALGGVAMKYVSEKVQDAVGLTNPLYRTLLDLGLAFGIPYAVRKNRKMLQYALPAGTTFGIATLIEAYNNYDAGLYSDALPSFAGGANLVNGGASIVNGPIGTASQDYDFGSSDAGQF